jgi:PAS domain S-box-containing protein
MDILHPQDRDAALKRYRIRQSGKDILDIFEATIIRKDAKRVPIELSSTISEYQGVSALITFFRDITDRRQAEEALRKSEERYRELVENAVMGFYQIEKHGTYRMVNRRMAEIFGYTSPQAFMEDIGNVSELYAKPDERFKILQQIDEKGFLEGIEVEFRKKTGESIWVKLNTRATTDNDGWIIYEGTLEDITERKQMEEERKRLENQLQQAYKMEAIGTLAGGIAHDFNNILTPIIVQSELALMDIDEKNPIRFNLQEVMKAGLRAKDLVKQILTFSRQSEQQPIPLRITPIIREAIKLLRASLPTTIEMQLNLEKDEDMVMADPTQIHQVLMNLCTNAAHAMRDRGGNLNVSLNKVELDSEYTSRFSELEPGPYTKLAVSDSGHGISPEVIDRIFDPFFTTKDRSEGTGMGLAVVHGIIKSYGGEITVESEPGKGATFNVFIPRVKTADIDEPEIKTELPSGTERVLVIDDEQGMVETLCRMLDRLGYQTSKRTSSVEALELFKAEPDRFDLVITDQTMPNITGMELAKTFMDIRPDMPIILCTGFSEKINEDSAKAMGISAFILKPIVMRDIAHTIRQVLDPALSKG